MGSKANWGEVVAAAIVEAEDLDDLGDTAAAIAEGDQHDDIDGLGDELARGIGNGPQAQLLEPVKRPDRALGMDGRDTTGMAGAPGVEQIDRFATTHFADRNAV